MENLDRIKEILNSYDRNFCDANGIPYDAKDQAEAFDTAVLSLATLSKLQTVLQFMLDNGMGIAEVKMILSFIEDGLKGEGNENID